MKVKCLEQKRNLAWHLTKSNYYKLSSRHSRDKCPEILPTPDWPLSCRPSAHSAQSGSNNKDTWFGGHRTATV
jgi:hypothetical protein